MGMEYMSEYSMDKMENIHFVVVEIHIKTDIIQKMIMIILFL